ncbi:MAG: Rab family GTPase, partial [Promethearchaeota archaeon]
ESLLDNFMDVVPGVIAVSVIDPAGGVFGHAENASVDEGTRAGVPGAIRPVLAELREHFSFQKFGTASFETDDFRLLFVDTSREFILCIVLDIYANIDATFPYAYILAEKVAQVQEGRLLDTLVPRLGVVGETGPPRLKNLLYPVRFKEGDYKYKLLLLGDTGVGKTSLIIRFVENKFKGDYRPTIGLNLLTHEYRPAANPRASLRFVMWDVGSQEYFKRVRRIYYEGADVAFVVFDLTSEESLSNVPAWKEELLANVGTRSDGTPRPCPVVLVGNKNDLDVKRVVRREDAARVAGEIGAFAYLETSAKTGEHVDDAFALVAYRLLEGEVTQEEERAKKDLARDFLSLLDRLPAGSAKFALLGDDPFWNPFIHFFQAFTGAVGPLVAHGGTLPGGEYTYANNLVVRHFVLQQGDDWLEGVDGCHGVVVLARGTPDGSGGVKPVNWAGVVARLLPRLREGAWLAVGAESGNPAGIRPLQESVEGILAGKHFDRAFFFQVTGDYLHDVIDCLRTLFNAI